LVPFSCSSIIKNWGHLNFISVTLFYVQILKKKIHVLQTILDGFFFERQSLAVSSIYYVYLP
jgi:hypothetical protein